MQYHRMPIEVESPEELGYSNIVCNLAESSVRDRSLKDLNVQINDELLAYGAHRGNDLLRKLIIEGEDGLEEADVLVTVGAIMSLFIIATSLLERGDHMIVIRPNYAANFETPRAIGCEISFVDLKLEEKFSITASAIIAAIKPNTKLISLTSPHNPTGVILDANEMLKIIDYAESRGIIVVVDETYRELNFQTNLLPYYAALRDHVVSVSSMSKSYGVPGIRIGWLITKNKKLMTTFLAAKEQIMLSNPTLEEAIAISILQNKAVLLPSIHEGIRVNYAILKTWLAGQKNLDYVLPSAGVVCFPKVKDTYSFDASKFQHQLFSKYQTLVGFGHWFEQDGRHFRIGFGFPTTDELKMGLNNIEACITECIINT